MRRHCETGSYSSRALHRGQGEVLEQGGVVGVGMRTVSSGRSAYPPLRNRLWRHPPRSPASR